MKKIYEKPIFIKTMYVSNEFIANDEENYTNEMAMFSVDLGNYMSSSGNEVIFVGTDGACDCGKCKVSNICVTVISCDC